MAVAGHIYVFQVLQSRCASFLGGDAAQRLTVQHVEHLDIQKVQHVNAFSRALDPFPNRLGVRPRVQEDRNHGGGVQDDQRPLAEFARLVGVSHRRIVTSGGSSNSTGSGLRRRSIISLKAGFSAVCSISESR